MCSLVRACIFSAYNGLRNAIAHSAWKEGARPNSVKPLGLSVRGGEVTLRGVEKGERACTDQELIDIVPIRSEQN
jgi:hypothetical protein